MNTRVLDPHAERQARVVLHYWGRRGGGSHFTLSLAQHLSPSVEVFLSLSRHNDDMETFKASGLPILDIDRPKLSTLWRQGWTLLWQLKRHADALAALKPDAVIITMNSPFAWPFIHALRRRDLKVIYVAHDSEPHPGDYAATWQRTTQDLLIRTADRVVALSNAVAERIVERLPVAKPKISVVPIETIYPSSGADSPPRPEGSPVRLLFYGRLLPYKGLKLLAQALEPMKAQSGWRLTIAGAGPLENDVRRWFSGWEQVDLQLGWVSDLQTDILYASHDLLLCPYSEASQSGVVAVATSWGMPSLVMPTGALPEQIDFGRAGLIARTTDAEGFRQALEEILAQPGCMQELSEQSKALRAERQAHRGWFSLVEPIPSKVSAPAG
ncbi:glycosyltransferase family 4 protein [Microvirga sp. P5_D2]